MKLEVSLDHHWIDDYETTVTQLIEQEINAAVRSEVKKLVQSLVKKRLDIFVKDLTKKVSKMSPAHFDKWQATLKEIKE